MPGLVPRLALPTFNTLLKRLWGPNQGLQKSGLINPVMSVMGKETRVLRAETLEVPLESLTSQLAI